MDAVISGRAGKALLLDGESLKSFDVDDPSEIVSRRQSDLPYLFGEAQDLRVIENADVESVKQALQHDCDFNWALDLTLISLDAELPDDIRKEAIEGLDELLSDSRVVERLEGILYARPLPEDADLVGAIKLCNEVRSSNASALLRSFGQCQLLIYQVSQAWDTIPTKIFVDYERQVEFQQVAAREGLFRSLVTVRQTKSPISTFLLNAGLNESIKQLPNYRQVLQHWASPFRQPGEVPKIKPELEEEFEEETSTRRRHGRRIGLNRQAVLREVNKRKSIILEAMRRQDFVRIHELVNDLISYQLSSGETVHAAKSLCDLATEAKALGMHPLQLEMTERSISIAPDDDWSWAQYGDALLNMHRLDDALTAYQQADAFGAGVIAKTGRAEVFKAKGELDKALAAYDEIIAEHPENVVAKTGRAEVLKAKGELNKALAAYDEIITEHPEDDVARRGRAEVLKAKGELNKALAAYDEIIAEHPNDAIAKNGRSCVLAALGYYDEALESLPDKSPITLQDWINHHVRGMILLRTGKVSEAIRIFNDGVQNTPWHSQREYCRSALAIAWLRGRDFKKASQALEEVTSPLLQPPANILRLHAFGASGNLQRATAAYNELAAKPHFLSYEVTQELRHQFLLGEEPRHDEDWIFDQEVKIILLNTGIETSRLAA
ncbi:MAG: hypothetical protein AUG51_09050 [Acidobacteria bacterium 13_1_20CM_3_53_8]|nr:MAG: hypothetical protein AUG51_09050 [Acidobacteria bacterium 13_1_20CM_3_53_8]